MGVDSHPVPVVLLIHSNPSVRASLAAGLTARGLTVVEAGDADAAVEAVDAEAIEVALVDPAVLEEEEFDLQARIEVRCGKTIAIVALAHLADPARKKAFARHKAVTLDRPADDLDAMAAHLASHATRGARRPEPSGIGRMELERMKPAATDEPLDAVPRADGQEPRVLIVEDDEDARGLFEKILSAKGYRVHSVGSATSALRFLRKEQADVDLILCDILLPQMDGFELKQTLDAEGGGAIPFIAVSGSSNAERQGLAHRLGMRALLPKPIQARALCKVVHDALVPAEPSQP